LYLKYVNDYPYATANGFNLWMLFGGQTVHDSGAFLGLTFAAWEKILLLILWVFVLRALTKIKNRSFSLYYLAYLLAFGFFMFYGRMHERYLVPALIFLMVCVLRNSLFGIVAAALSVCVWINQHYLYELAKRDIYWLAKDDTIALTVSAISLIILGFSFYFYIDKRV
jgi:Gpi18-like mannosyltransferase